MPVDLTETENKNDSVNRNDAAKMTLQNDVAVLATQEDGIISPNKPLIPQWISSVTMEKS